MLNPVPGFGTSFGLTYYEKKHGVQRPRLNETNFDPDLSRAGIDDKSFSRLAKNWAWDVSVRKDYEDEDMSMSMSKRYNLDNSQIGISNTKRYNLDNSHLNPILE